MHDQAEIKIPLHRQANVPEPSVQPATGQAWSGMQAFAEHNAYAMRFQRNPTSHVINESQHHSSCFRVDCHSIALLMGELCATIRSKSHEDHLLLSGCSAVGTFGELSSFRQNGRCSLWPYCQHAAFHEGAMGNLVIPKLVLWARLGA